VNLAKAVSEVRAAIGDVTEQPRWIRTVHGYGYAFCGEAASDSEQPHGSGHWVVWGRRVVPLAPGENLLGRDPSAGIWLDSDQISRRHARIVISGSDATIEDLGSNNGTYVRGDRISTSSALAPGDRIQAGPFVLRYRRRDQMTSTRTRGIVLKRSGRP
jgi:FHA domain